MGYMSIHRSGLLVCVLLVLGACSGERDPPSWTLPPTVASPEDDERTTEKDRYYVGDVVSGDMSWEGYPKGSSELGTVALSSYHDPDGSQGVNALLLVQIRVSCPACQWAAEETPAMLQGWEGLGIDVIHLVYKESSSSTATTDTALQWKTEYEATWAVAVDPNFTFAHEGTNYIPIHVLVDPRTLEIVGRQEGNSEEFLIEVEQLAQQNLP